MGRKNNKKKWLQHIKQRILRYSLYVFAAFLGITLLFRIVPVPFSSYMAQQKVSHLLNGESYPIKYQWVSLDDISWQMQLAVIAAEDQKFAQHHGIDWNAINNALKYNKKSTKVRGGSTISQQTVKNLYLWHGQSWLRKAIELPTTLMLEQLWSKKRILEVYLNIAEFGYGIFGVEAASQAYFKKSAKQLNQQEAALLAAVLPNPILFKANKPSAFVQKRQRWIMRQMNALGKGYLTQLN
ncbi:MULTISPECIES: monofunctional biosynthetic peptidoglycan transglycosylase [unclassified Avibacterium]|uniref:monofunctional biosynthetic peptidoglycan transglycosylase n=1 Tax=unclassified Avibacterium TaxID=2685287 RepID=UPI002026ED91|nr:MULTISPECIES: monofunctional biosynthetic peptidoglycan transglycosylase [unclassified Avibacterium]MCW9717953.1 monofunctional biosynthetic peptidoglycan transglycosylase [Avibacterium sp. 21-599]MCW9734094.1 monofunctional biosynthetic peptidoglycan transglycosylase [Avibacterium sp. 20-15]URL03741.1 monofunctional biosynthetic peptidoglycan transglycosylase [Avibacterium sp. 20-132]